MPPFSVRDLLGIVVAVLGTAVLIVLAASCSGFSTDEGLSSSGLSGCAARLLIAGAIGLANLAHIVGLMLFQTVAIADSGATSSRNSPCTALWRASARRCWSSNTCRRPIRRSAATNSDKRVGQASIRVLGERSEGPQSWAFLMPVSMLSAGVSDQKRGSIASPEAESTCHIPLGSKGRE